MYEQLWFLGLKLGHFLPHYGLLRWTVMLFFMYMNMNL